MSDKKIRFMVTAAVMAALTYVATTVVRIPAPTGGYVHMGDGLVLLCGWILGPWWGGAAAGIVLKEKTGAKVEQGQTLAVLHTDRPETLADAERVFLEAIRWGADAPAAQPLIYGIVTE